MTLLGLGATARRQGTEEDAANYLERGAALARSIGFELALTFGLSLLSRALARRRDMAGARELYRESLDLAWRLQNHLSIPYVLLDGAKLAADSGDAERAARLFGASARAREIIGMPRDPSPGHAAGVDYEETIRGLRAVLGETRLAGAIAEGEAMPIADALRDAAGEGPRISERAATSVSMVGPYGLTPRELEVLELLAMGRSDREIGDTLFISPRTAQVHVARIIAKLEVSNRAGAAAVAVREGLIAPPQ
jgi:DNA-binding CsgD family transcriptional regulator